MKTKTTINQQGVIIYTTTEKKNRAEIERQREAGS